MRVVIECKQYERSSLSVRNLIHEWHSKNEVLEFDRVILAIVGQEVTEADRDLADQFGIVIWDGSKIDDLLDRAIENREAHLEILLREMGIASEHDWTVHKSSQLKLIREAIEEALTWDGEPETLEIWIADDRGEIPQTTPQPIVQFGIEDGVFSLALWTETGYTSDQLSRVASIVEQAGISDPEEGLDIDTSPFGSSSYWARLGSGLDRVSYVAEQVLVDVWGMRENDGIVIRRDARYQKSFRLVGSKVLPGSEEVKTVGMSGPCFIATCIYGEYGHGTRVLRSYRDQVLRKSALGRLLVELYYLAGPLAVGVLKQSAMLRACTRSLLDTVVERLDPPET